MIASLSLLEKLQEKNFRLKKWMTILVIILSVHSTAGFAMFIAEEAMQTAMFSAFAYQNAKDWTGLEWHVKYVMKPVQKTGETIIGFACLPGILFCPAYMNYIKANEGYIKGVESQIRAHK